MKKKYYYKYPTVTITLVEPLFNDLSGFIGAGTYPVGTSITISAPSTIVEQQTATTHSFIRWAEFSDHYIGNTTVNVTPTQDTTYTAVYYMTDTATINIDLSGLGSSHSVDITYKGHDGISNVLNYVGGSSNNFRFSLSILNIEQDITFKINGSGSTGFWLKDTNNNNIFYTHDTINDIYTFHWTFNDVSNIPTLKVYS